MSATTGNRDLASTIHRALSALLGAELPIGIRAWDSSEYAVVDPVATLDLRSPLAARHVLWSPGELGLARAYVSGALDVEGDLGVALSEVRRSAEVSKPRAKDLLRARTELARMLRALTTNGALGSRPDPPPEEARLSGRLHTPGRDRSAISHHYDLGNDFYELLLDDTMAYSCGVWDKAVAAPTPADGAAASHAKLDLICRKLDLRPGMRLVDVGCGWGSLLIHAATCFGVRATGVTISQAQAEHVRSRIARTGLADRVEVRVQDYRELDVEGLREHYVLTVKAWARTLEDHWDDVVALAGEGTARIWRLYLAGGGLAFAENRMGVDQILAVRPHAGGASGMPLSRYASAQGTVDA